MILAAGLGTRLKPLTDTMPKALVPVAGQPLLWHIIMKLKSAGFSRIVVNVHHFAQQIVDYLEANDRFGLDILISDESRLLLDTGGGLKKAMPLFSSESPVLIHNVDILSNADVSAFYDKAQQADALLLVCHRDTSRYLLFDDDMRLAGWTNDDKGIVRCPNPALNPATLQKLAFSGIHVVHPRLMTTMQDMPECFGIFDYYMKYCGDYRFWGYLKSDLQMLDVGKLYTLTEAEQFISKL